MTISPKTAPLRRASRRSARRVGVSIRASRRSAVNAGEYVASAISTPQPWIDEDVKDIGDEIERDVCGGSYQNDSLHDRIVAIEHRVDDELAETRNCEDLLGQHRPREQRAELERAERDHRGERVAHG